MNFQLQHESSGGLMYREKSLFISLGMVIAGDFKYLCENAIKVDFSVHLK